MSKVTNLSGTAIDFATAVWLMDDEIREDIHMELPSTISEQEFFTAYEQTHKAKYGEEWELSKENPVY